MPADLHVHTTCSDSTWSPKRVIEECEKNGITTVGIADHDTVDGVPLAEAAGKHHNVRVIPAVEMTAYHNEKEIHIVGLFIDRANPEMIEILRLTREERVIRVEKMVALLQKLNIKITVEDVMKLAKGAPGRPHVAQALLAIGQVSTIGEAFKKYIGSDGPAYVAKYEISPADAAKTIHGAGGAAVVAHPGASLSEDDLRQMVKEGMDGFEVYHPLHTPAQSKRFLEIADELGVVISGGSDSHGEVREGTSIGNIRLDDSLVDKIEEAAKKWRK